MTGSHVPHGYRLRVDGHLPDHWSGWFGYLTLARENDGTTSLSGPVTDQAALHGLLTKIRDLGILLISVEPIDATDQSRSDSGDAIPWEGETNNQPRATESMGHHRKGTERSANDAECQNRVFLASSNSCIPFFLVRVSRSTYMLRGMMTSALSWTCPGNQGPQLLERSSAGHHPSRSSPKSVA